MSDEVSQFLEQVERLRGQQIEDDEVRARELEEYLAAKRERQARRAERARSISPQKSSPVNTPSPRSNRRSVHVSDALKLESPAAPSKEEDTAPEPQSKSKSMSKPAPDDDATMAHSPTDKASSMPARSGTLSWQQRRPNSRGGAARPLSMVAAQNATQRSLAGSQEPASATEQTFSRDQIAQALGSKDPAWFRQTSDRGASSAAYRKNQVEDEDRLDMASVKAQLPGMAQDPPKQAALPEPATSTQTRTLLTSPPTLNPPKLDLALNEDKPTERALAKSPSGRTSPFRTTSPTKGVGGFVQSAMMKRSDSVKRWSVTSPPGLARVDSIASSRSSVLTPSRPHSMIRPGSTTPSSSRPTSQHGEKDDADSTPRGPTLNTSLDRTPRTEEGHLPISPSKTMDPRRWSPTKSSWLESALNKPESPKPRHKPSTSQPAWMAELNKNKAERANNPSPEPGGRPRPGSISHKHQVSVGGLMRSSPMGSPTKTNPPGLGGIYSPPVGANRPGSQNVGLGISKSVPKFPPLEPKEEMTDPVPEPELEPKPEVHAEVEKEKGGEEVQAPETPQEPVAPLKLTSPRLTSPPVTKPKPETPPKKDFRANLKHRTVGPEPGKSQEPEFRNVFGNLRRTKTQNYVAPDELKDNILRGKASLNATGGPKKTERVDEFKEAILKKKDDFKKAQTEGRGVTRTATIATTRSLPEGLARRAELGRSVSSKNDSPTEPSPPPEAKKLESPKPSPGPKRVPSGPLRSPTSPATPTSAKTDDEPAKKEAAIKKEPLKPAQSPAAEPRALPGLGGPLPPFVAPGRVGGRLADRMNPALAGMFARGPPAMATNGGRSSEDSASKGSSKDSATEPTTTGPQLTHMTKGRARGPRRKAPTTATAAVTAKTTAASEKRPPPEATARVPEEAAKPKLPAASSPKPQEEVKEESQPSPVDKAEAETPGPLSIQQQVSARASLRSKPSPVSKPLDKAVEGFKVAEPVTPSLLRKKSSSPVKESVEAPSPLKSQKTGGDEASSPKKLDTKRMSRFFDETPADSPKPESSREPAKLTRQRTGSVSPVKGLSRPLPEPEASSPTKVDSESVFSVKNATSMFGGAALKTSSPVSKPSFDGPSPEVETPKRQRTPANPSPASKPAFEKATPEVETPKASRTPSARPSPSPKPYFVDKPLPGDKPLPKVGTSKSYQSLNRPLPVPPTEETKSTPTIASPNNKPKNDVTAFLQDFFGPHQVRSAFRADTAEILMNRPKVGGKIQSTSFEMFQISGDGKKALVPPHFERVLFEREMYLCPHSFVNEAGWKRSEVYFWIGDEVPESSVEDAHVFIQREVRAVGGTMIKIRQGKETCQFLQALGGVATIRRGSSNKYDSLGPNMLCGRRYMGQIVFDEVDFSSANLCSGFPYLITHNGKCYLWKGKGSDVDEVGCARLVGMDLTLTGELIEYDDGSEPASFWELFEGGTKPHSADHWRLKPNYNMYCSRLFCSNADGRRQISEVSPFNQADLSPSHIYVLDAFFEMYIIVGANAQSQYASFRNALDFAQEYAILASSTEDRPFIPISTIVLEGVPRDLKRVFRKWRDSLSPTPVAAQPGLKRGRSLRVVSLTQALQVLSE